MICYVVEWSIPDFKGGQYTRTDGSKLFQLKENADKFSLVLKNCVEQLGMNIHTLNITIKSIEIHD